MTNTKTNDTTPAVEAPALEVNAPKKPEIKQGYTIEYFRVATDGILNNEAGIAAGNAYITGRVSKDDIEGAGADFDWLLRTGQIIPDGKEFYEA